MYVTKQYDYQNRADLDRRTRGWIANEQAKEAAGGLPFRFDNFETDPRIVWAALNEIHLPAMRFQSAQPIRILDAGAGDNANWTFRAALNWERAELTGVELRNVRKPELGHIRDWERNARGNPPLVWHPDTDFLTFDDADKFDLVMMNPPFKLTEDFLEHGYELLTPHGVMVAFTRLAIIAGQERGAGMWTRIMPFAHYVLPERPSFTGNGKTDIKTEYMVTYWRRDYGGEPVMRRLWWKHRERVAEPVHTSYQW